MNGAEIVFADVDPETGLMRPEDLRRRACARRPCRCGVQCASERPMRRRSKRSRPSRAPTARRSSTTPAMRSAPAMSRSDGSVTTDRLERVLRSERLLVSSGEGHRDGRRRRGDGQRSGTGQAARARAQPRHDARSRRFPERGRCVRRRRRAQSLVLRAGRAGVQLARQRHPMRARPFAAGQARPLRRAPARARGRYDALLAPLAPIVRPLARTRSCLPAWHLYVVRIDFERAGIARAAVDARVWRHDGIGTQVHYFPVHRQPYYANALRHARRCPAPIAIMRRRSACRCSRR